MRPLSGRRRRTALGLAGLAVAVGLGVEPVAAHPAWEQYVELRWGGDLTYTFEASFPTGEWRDRVRDGVTAWPRSIGVPAVAFASSGADWDWRDACGNGLHGVHHERIDGAGGTLAETRWCFDDDRIISTEIRFDSAEAWWTGDATTVPAGSSDLESVAAHEAGHGWGWSGPHLSGADVCGSDALRHTMCATVTRGTATQRTPEEHDLHIVDPAYADPAPK